MSDAKAIAGVRGTIAGACPCATFDASTPDKTRGKFVKCAKGVIKDATDGTALPGGYALRKQCKAEVTRTYTRAACGYAPGERVMCCEAKVASGKTNAKTRPVAKCVDSGSGQVVRHACFGSAFAPEACSGTGTNECRNEVAQQTLNIASAAQPANTPGSPSVTVSNVKLIAQFGGTGFSLNNSRYTRYSRPVRPPSRTPSWSWCRVSKAALPGSSRSPRISSRGPWRSRSSSRCGPSTAGRTSSRTWWGSIWPSSTPIRRSPSTGCLAASSSLTLHPLLAAGPNRRAVFYDTQADVPFIANWSPLVFSQDIDAVVTAARAVAKNQNVFLGGHSAGTGFTARYAATDFNLTGVGPADPGYAKLRGLVLLEGGGGASAAARRRPPIPWTASRPSSMAACSAPCATTLLAASTESPPAPLRTRRSTASGSCRPSARCRPLRTRSSRAS